MLTPGNCTPVTFKPVPKATTSNQQSQVATAIASAQHLHHSQIPIHLTNGSMGTGSITIFPSPATNTSTTNSLSPVSTTILINGLKAANGADSNSTAYTMLGHQHHQSITPMSMLEQQQQRMDMIPVLAPHQQQHVPHNLAPVATLHQCHPTSDSTSTMVASALGNSSDNTTTSESSDSESSHNDEQDMVMSCDDDDPTSPNRHRNMAMNDNSKCNDDETINRNNTKTRTESAATNIINKKNSSNNNENKENKTCSTIIGTKKQSNMNVDEKKQLVHQSSMTCTFEPHSQKSSSNYEYITHQIEGFILRVYYFYCFFNHPIFKIFMLIFKV